MLVLLPELLEQCRNDRSSGTNQGDQQSDLVRAGKRHPAPSSSQVQRSIGGIPPSISDKPRFYAFVMSCTYNDV